MTSAALGALSKEELIAEVLRIQSESESRVAELTFQLDQLKRQIFGARSERFVPKEVSPNQLELDFGKAVEIAKPAVRPSGK